jgi:hypothetical protein
VERVIGFVRGLGLRIAWLAVAVLIAAGSAGVVASLDRFPGTTGRPELTATADGAAMRQLDASTSALTALTEDVAALGERGRFALAALAGPNLDQLEAALADGTESVAAIDAAIARLRTALGAVQGIGPGEELVLSPGVRARYDVLAASVPVAADLSDEWRALVRGAGDASRLITLLERQEQEIAAAAAEGTARRWGAALLRIEAAEAALDEAGKLRDRLKNAADVSTLTLWIDRNRAYDQALRDLYAALQASRGRTTDAVRKAFAAERLAKDRLPGDTRALIVIMADVAQGGLNQAVIAIELARGELERSVVDAEELEAGPLPTPAL